MVVTVVPTALRHDVALEVTARGCVCRASTGIVCAMKSRSIMITLQVNEEIKVASEQESFQSLCGVCMYCLCLFPYDVYLESWSRCGFQRDYVDYNPRL